MRAGALGQADTSATSMAFCVLTSTTLPVPLRCGNADCWTRTRHSTRLPRQMKGGQLLTIFYLLKRILQLYSHSSDVALEERTDEASLAAPSPIKHRPSSCVCAPLVGGRAPPTVGRTAEVRGWWHHSRGSDVAGPPDWQGSGVHRACTVVLLEKQLTIQQSSSPGEMYSH